MGDESVIGDETVIGGDGGAEKPPPDGERELAERLRAALLAADPDLHADELAGDTADAVRERYAAARARRATVSAGAPGRLPPAPLNALGKIRAGLARLDD